MFVINESEHAAIFTTIYGSMNTNTWLEKHTSVDPESSVDLGRGDRSVVIMTQAWDFGRFYLEHRSNRSASKGH